MNFGLRAGARIQESEFRKRKPFVFITLHSVFSPGSWLLTTELLSYLKSFNP